MKCSLIICFLLLSKLTVGQGINVELDSLCSIADEWSHVEFLTDKPKEHLITPNLGKDTVKYLTLFYSQETSNDDIISVLVDEKNDRDILYADINNDENLLDDGKPIIFLHSENEKFIDIRCEKDPKQVVRLAIGRTPNVPDSLIYKYVDKYGNLNRDYLKFLKAQTENPDFDGRRGSFYFDRRITLRKGVVKLNGILYNIGLFDYSNNGLYNDSDDVLIVDLNHDNKLGYFSNSEVFKLNDVFNIGDYKYKLSKVDKYGKNLVLIETMDKPTHYFLTYSQKENAKSAQKSVVANDFWDKIFKTLKGQEIKFSSLKGKYIFINFWGEWCSPCLAEIPELVNGYNKWKDKVVFLSFIKVANIEKAKKVIENNKIKWPQIKLSPETEKKFHVAGYPTNILILPDGINYIKEATINRTFFELNVKE